MFGLLIVPLPLQIRKRINEVLFVKQVQAAIGAALPRTAPGTAKMRMLLATGRHSQSAACSFLLYASTPTSTIRLTHPSRALPGNAAPLDVRAPMADEPA